MQPDKFVFWLDHNLPKSLVIIIKDKFNLRVLSLLELGYETKEDEFIFKQASSHSDLIIIITKDKDFVQLMLHKGPPPKILWITIGNCTNNQIKELFLKHFLSAVEKLKSYDFVEISNSI